MKNKDLWQAYTEYTFETTKHARQLAFAGAAICWFFRSPEVTFPRLIMVALLVFVLYFVVDIVQYITAAVKIRDWTLAEEKRQWEESDTIDGEYHKPASLDYWPYRLFVAKLVVLLAAFMALGAEFVRRL